MNKIIRYGLYEARIFMRVKTAVFYSILFPIVLLLLSYFANYSSGNFNYINNYFPYLLSVTLISTSGGLASLIVNNRVYNMWKFYNFYGYKTWQMAISTGLIYLIISELICVFMMGIMLLGLGAIKITLYQIVMFILAAGLGSVVYIEMAVITGLSVNDPKNAQTVINGLIYLFVVLSGSIVRFDANSVMGRVMLMFPNIHIGNLLHGIWNFNQVSVNSLIVITLYVIIFAFIILYLITKERKKLLY